MPNILVIDSDPGTRVGLAQAVGALGDVDLATTGLEALRLLATKTYALVLLDLHVRPLDGFVILRTLAAKDGPNKETPVYAIAADAAEQARALREHAVFALIKPLMLSTVTNLVDAGLRKPSPPPDESPSTPPVSTGEPPGSSARPQKSTRPPGAASIPAPSMRPAPAVKTSPVPPAPVRAAGAAPLPGPSGARAAIPPPSPSRPAGAPDKPKP